MQHSSACFKLTTENQCGFKNKNLVFVYIVKGWRFFKKCRSVAPKNWPGGSGGRAKLWKPERKQFNTSEENPKMGRKIKHRNVRDANNQQIITMRRGKN